MAAAAILGGTRPLVLDGIDRAIVRATQAGLPLTAAPYRAIGEAVGISEAEVIRRMTAMLEHGVIRRIGAVPNHYRLGYRGNAMSVWDVSNDRVEAIGEKIGALDFVSHCYWRPRHPPLWPYNLFAMVHGRTRDEAMEKVARIAEILGTEDRGHDALLSSRILKKTGLRIAG
ncbi:MAG: Lrp/AsnC family transcriptional regulator [Inquilinus sp.]|nr:Lrp/AsnC family transcriptional regulator [Inquilinus sp.]